MRATCQRVHERLARDGLVYRYQTDDGLPPGEGAFLACSFWLADNLALVGRHDDARAMFERLLALRNDVGLLAEDEDGAAEIGVTFSQAAARLAQAGVRGRLLRGALDRLDAERANIAAAMDWALHERQLDVLLGFIEGQSDYWLRRGALALPSLRPRVDRPCPCATCC